MSTNNPYEPLVTSEIIEASMKKARLERSKAMWDLLQRLFSRPESRETDDADFGLTQPKLRRG